MRAGQPMRGVPKSEPIRRVGCAKDNCLVGGRGEGGNCEKGKDKRTKGRLFMRVKLQETVLPGA